MMQQRKAEQMAGMERQKEQMERAIRDMQERNYRVRFSEIFGSD